MITFTLIAVAKTVWPQAWRFHEAGFLDPYIALGSCACLAFIWAYSEPSIPMDAFGHQLATWYAPDALTRHRRVHRVLELCMLPAGAFMLALPIDLCRPRELQQLDDDQGTWPLAADFMCMLDAVAILPQFARFHSQRTRHCHQGTMVSHILALWLATTGVARCMALLSGVFNVMEDRLEANKWNFIEVFYSLCSGINVALISDFMYFYVRGLCNGEAHLVLPS